MQIILAQQGGQNRLRKRGFLFFAAVATTAAVAFRKIGTIHWISPLVDLVAVTEGVPVGVGAVRIGAQVCLIGIAQAIAVHVIITPAAAVSTVSTALDRKVLHPVWIDLTRLVADQVEHEHIKCVGRHGPAPDAEWLLQLQEHRFVVLQLVVVVNGDRELLDQRIPIFPDQPVSRLEERIDPVQRTYRACVICQRVDLVRLLLRKIIYIHRIGSSLELFAVAEPILIRIRVIWIGTIYCLMIIC